MSGSPGDLARFERNPNSLLITAGEASADHHAAKVVATLKAHQPRLSVFGMGGDKMIAAGFESIVHARELSVMGVFEVIRHLPRILSRERALKQAILERKPKVALLLDLPDFNLRLAKFLKRQGVYVIYYISPQVWAWRKKRVHLIRQVVDQMLCVLPFEADFYAQHAVPAEFVGHPLVEDLAHRPTQAEAEQSLGLKAYDQRVALLPGSRMQERNRLLDPILDAAALVAQQQPQAQFVIPVAGTVNKEDIAAQVATRRSLTGKVQIIEGKAQHVLASSRAAVIASGTASLEGALVGVPLVVVYRMSALSFAIARRIVKVASIVLANLILGENRIVELLQDDANAERIAERLLAALRSDEPQLEATSIRNALLHRLGALPATQRVVQVVEEAMRA